jgi:hypothetical protein
VRLSPVVLFGDTARRGLVRSLPATPDAPERRMVPTGPAMAPLLLVPRTVSWIISVRVGS